MLQIGIERKGGTHEERTRIHVDRAADRGCHHRHHRRDRYPEPAERHQPTATLRTFLEPTYVQRVPDTDGWNHAWYIDTYATGYTIGSGGKDDSYSGVAGNGGRKTDFDDDIVFSDGQFIQWPEGLQTD